MNLHQAITYIKQPLSSVLNQSAAASSLSIPSRELILQFLLPPSSGHQGRDTRVLAIFWWCGKIQSEKEGGDWLWTSSRSHHASRACFEIKCFAKHFAKCMRNLHSVRPATLKQPFTGNPRNNRNTNHFSLYIMHFMAEFSASPILNDSSWEFGEGDAYKGAVKKSTCFKYLMVQLINTDSSVTGTS